jgi:hypothetical protein
VLTLSTVVIEAIGAQVRLGPRNLSPQGCRDRTDNVTLQLEDPFGYDKADIKIDAIVEDLRVCFLLLLRLEQALPSQESQHKALNRLFSSQVETSVLIAEWRRASDMFTG